MTVENYNKITQKRYMENKILIALKLNCKEIELQNGFNEKEFAISIHIGTDLPNRQVVIELASASNSEINFQ